MTPAELRARVAELLRVPTEMIDCSHPSSCDEARSVREWWTATILGDASARGGSAQGEA